MTLMGRLRATRATRTDQGFSLIEVVVAVVLLAMIAMGVTAFFVRGVAAAAGNERRLAAVALADQAMEYIRSVPAQETTGVTAVTSKLVQGRSQADVEARWNGAAPHPTPPAEISDSEPAWESAAPTAAVLVPYSQEFQVGTQPYEVEYFIGTCTRSNAQDAQCAPAPASGAKLFRVVIRVSWDQGEGQDCSGNPCEYLLSTLIDPNEDPLFNSNSNPVTPPAPVADNDSATTPMNTAVSINVLDGDTGDLETAPVTLGTPPVNGTVSGAPSSPVTYTPAPGYYGTDTFTYTITDKFGRTSAEATVTVVVQRPAPPVARNDTYSVLAGSVTDLPVTANDDLAGTSSTTFTQPSSGKGSVASGPGSALRYTAPSAAATVTFTYTLREPTGQVSTATVTVTVTLPAPPKATNDAVTVPVGGTVNFTTLGNDTVTPGTTAAQLSAPNPTGRGTLTGSPGGGYSFVAGSVAGNVTFTYRLKDAYNQQSDATVTITITPPAPPRATNDNLTVFAGRTLDFSVLGNDTISASDTVTIASGLSPASSGTLTTTGRGTYRFVAGSTAGTASFGYRLTDAYNQQSTATATITVKPLPPRPQALGGTWCVRRLDTEALRVVINYSSEYNPYSAIFDVRPAGGTVTDLGDGVIQYTAPNQDANYTLRYRMMDGAGQVSDQVTVNLQVRRSC